MNRLKQLRESKNITQTELGKIIGIQTSAVSKYETGKVPIPIESLTALSKYFNVTIDYILLNDEKEKTADNKITISLLSAGIDSDSLTKKEIDEMINYVKFIVQKRK